MNESSGPLKKKSLRGAIRRVAESTTRDNLDKEADNALEGEKIADSQSNRTLREGYAAKVYWYLVCYSLGAFVLLALHRFKWLGFSLDTSVLALIVGSTAVSAIGLVGIVARSLFRGGN